MPLFTHPLLPSRTHISSPSAHILSAPLLAYVHILFFHLLSSMPQVWGVYPIVIAAPDSENYNIREELSKACAKVRIPRGFHVFYF